MCWVWDFGLSFVVGFLFGWVFSRFIRNQKSVNFDIHSPFSVTAFQSLVQRHFTVSLLSFGIGVLKFYFFAYYALLLILYLVNVFSLLLLCG